MDEATPSGDTPERAPRRPEVVAVVLTWNDVEMTADCVASVLANDYQPLRVLLVDNGSDTPCGEEVKARFPTIELLTLPRNQGFSGGSNRGIERALEMGADYVHLIGNDSTLDPHAISSLVAALEADPDAGGASPLLLHPGDERRVQFYRGTIERDICRHEHLDNEIPFDSRSWPTIRTDFVPFVAVMFRADAFREIGMFDESFGTCWEDYDLCMRFLEGGRPFLSVGIAQAVHKGSITTGRFSPYITYYTTRNRLVCMFRYGRPLDLLRNALRIARTYWWQIKTYGLSNWACHRAFALGVIDFVFGVRGEARPALERKG